MIVKQCFKCGEIKDLSEFYKHPQMSDGHLNKCRECTKNDVAQNYSKRREQYAEYERRRYQDATRKAYASEQCRKLKCNNPEKAEAWSLVWSALRCGRLQRHPCSVCGDSRVEAHHEDYSKPLDVVWLCRKHHLELHGKVAYA